MCVDVYVLHICRRQWISTVFSYNRLSQFNGAVPINTSMWVHSNMVQIRVLFFIQTLPFSIKGKGHDQNTSRRMCFKILLGNIVCIRNGSKLRNFSNKMKQTLGVLEDLRQNRNLCRSKISTRLLCTGFVTGFRGSWTVEGGSLFFLF